VERDARHVPRVVAHGRGRTGVRPPHGRAGRAEGQARQRGRRPKLFADGFADAIYLDGDHRYGSVLADLAAWRGKVRAGGIIAGHDWWMPEVRRAVFESFARPPDAIYGDGVKGEGTWVYRV
jgi:hypothetical protein